MCRWNSWLLKNYVDPCTVLLPGLMDGYKAERLLPPLLQTEMLLLPRDQKQYQERQIGCILSLELFSISPFAGGQQWSNLVNRTM